jgi:hypothetical protein
MSPPRLSRLVVGNVMDNEGSLFTVTLVLGLIFVGMGGLNHLHTAQPAAEEALISLTLATGARGALTF